MTKFALFDAGGLPLSFWSEDIHGAREADGTANPTSLIPAEATAITDQQWRAFLTHQGVRKWQDGHVVSYDPPAPAPSTNPQDYPLAPYQFRAMMKIAGIEQAVADAIAAMEDPAEKAVADAKLEYALSYNRDDPLFAMLAPAVGLTAAQIDALWMQAKAL